MGKNVVLLEREGSANVALLERAVAPVAPSILTTGLPEARPGHIYNQVIQVAGTPFPAVSVDGDLPDGLTFNPATRTLSGPLTEPGLYEIEFVATNASGSDTKTLTLLVVNEGPGFTFPIITAISLSPASANVNAGATTDLTATVWSEEEPMRNIMGAVTSSASGVATAEQLAVTDQNGQATVRVTAVAGGSANVRVAFDGVQSNQSAISVAALFAPTITTDTLPSATVGVPYSAKIDFTGFPSPTLAVTAGSLPPGLTLNANTGEITGTASGTTAQLFEFTVTATNSQGSVSKALSIARTVTMQPPVITTAALPPAIVGQQYSFAFQATGGTPRTWSATGLPSGFELSAAGVLTGLLSSLGTHQITVTVSNAASSDTKVFTLTGQLPAGRRIVIDNLHPDILEETSIHGVVFAPKVGGEILGAEVGEFFDKVATVSPISGARIEVLLSEFGGEALATGSVVNVYLTDRNGDASHAFEATVTD